MNEDDILKQFDKKTVLNGIIKEFYSISNIIVEELQNQNQTDFFLPSSLTLESENPNDLENLLKFWDQEIVHETFHQ